mmetsp:Transcript_25210/g.44750  ORF Transcript_25210/g.44750 Transcript_25210/m.44750 type:complete len:288 (+) Transcript_25210:2328-3191(+)
MVFTFDSHSIRMLLAWRDYSFELAEQKYSKYVRGRLQKGGKEEGSVALRENDSHSLCFVDLLCGIADARSGNSKLRICFGQCGTVIDGHDSIFTTALAKSQTSGRGMSNDITSNGLGRVLCKAHTVWVGHDLVRHKNSDSKLLRQTRQLTKELSKLHLSLRQFPTPGVISTEQCRGRVNDQECVPILCHNSCSNLEEFHLMFRVLRTSTCHILECGDWIETKPFGNGLKFFGTEAPFRVDVDGFSFGPSVGDCLLTSDTQGVTELCLSGPKLSKDFCDGSCFNPAFQ